MEKIRFIHSFKIKDFIIHSLHKINLITEFLATSLLFIAVLLMLLQIISRDILGRGGLFPWIWESITLCSLCLTYMGAATVFKQNRHIALDFYKKFSKSKKKIIQIIIKLIIIFTSLLVVAQVITLSKRLIGTSFITIPFITRGHATIIIGVGFFLITIYAFFSLFFEEVVKNDSNN